MILEFPRAELALDLGVRGEPREEVRGLLVTSSDKFSKVDAKWEEPEELQFLKGASLGKIGTWKILKNEWKKGKMSWTYL